MKFYVCEIEHCFKILTIEYPNVMSADKALDKCDSLDKL